jgi:hypothetical protein
MLHTLRFFLQNVVYFIVLPFLVTVLFTFYIQGVLKFKCKTPVVPKVNVVSFRPHYGPGVDSALTEMSTRNISWGVKAASA